MLWGGAVEVHCFGRPQNWSLAGGSPIETGWNNPGIRYRMKLLAEKYRCRHVYAPNPSRFNGRIAEPDEFDVALVDDQIMRGPFADGVILTEPNTAFAVSSADCPTVVHYEPTTGLTVGAHAGFESLYADRYRHSVIDAMVSALAAKLGSEPKLYRPAFVACGIGQSAYTFDTSHPKFSEKHAMLCEYASETCPDAITEIESLRFIDLAEIIRSQFKSIGFDKRLVGMDGACTAYDRGPDGEHLWHSNRRGDKSRNLVLVIRR